MKAYNVLDFGAVPDIDALQTDKIQAAIDECFLQGGGKIIVPKGVFLTGGLRIRSNCTLYLQAGAVLKGSRNPKDYLGYLEDKLEPLAAEEIIQCPWHRCETEGRDGDYRIVRLPGSRWHNALIRGIRAENAAIIGEEGSALDGSNCFDPEGEEFYRGPHCINLWYCKNVKFCGYTVRDSANWAHSLNNSKNILLEQVKVIAGHDGVHMTGCENIEIRSCEFYTGDDCVAGFANTNLYVTDCVINSSCSAMRLGGTNVLVEKCHMYGPCPYPCRGDLPMEDRIAGNNPEGVKVRHNMLSALTYYADYTHEIPVQPGNIIISDCKIERADKLLHFNYSGNETWQDNRPLASVRFEKLTAEELAMPAICYGDADVYVTLEIENCKISFREGAENSDFLQAANFKLISLKNVEVSRLNKEYLIKAWSEGAVAAENVSLNGKELDANNIVRKAEEEFSANPI